MTQTILELSLNKTKSGFQAVLFQVVLTNENKIVLGSNDFKYQVDKITILSELERFEPGKLDAPTRIEKARVFGRKMFDLVCSQDMRDNLKRILKNSDWTRLVVVTREDAEELSLIPWEFLHDGEAFLSAHEKIGFYRCPQGIEAEESYQIKDKIRILCLVSNPMDLEEGGRLNAEKEQENLLRALNPAMMIGRIEVVFEDEAKLENLEEAFDEGGFHILHYSGHGAHSEESGGSLLLEGEKGQGLPVGWRELEPVLKKGMAKGLRMVFLSGCQTAKTSDREAFNDLARPLLQAGLPAVIAMQYSIYDQSGISLAETFYRLIAKGEDIDLALNRARRKLCLNESPKIAGDFATPVLFTGQPDCLKISASARDLEEQALNDIEWDAWSHIPLQQLGLGFIGRRRELRQIKECFRENVRAVVIHGVGGVGKTVLATQAARRLRKQFKGVYTFDCSDGALSTDRIFDEVIKFLIMNGLEKLKNLAHAPLPSIQKATILTQILEQVSLLLIFDNMESLLDKEEKHSIENSDLAAFLKALINGATQGTKYLFTSRYTFNLLDDQRGEEEQETVGQRLAQAVHLINLGDVSESEAWVIMNKFPSLLAADSKLKSEIYQKLGGHPYMLGLFAKYCRDKAPREILDSLGELRGEMARFTMLEKSLQSLSASARTLLKRISVFRQAIPTEALAWVMGKEVELDPEMLEAWRRHMLESAEEALREKSIDQKKYEKDKKYLQELTQEDLGELYQKHYPQERQSGSLTTQVEELIHWGLLVRLPEEEKRSRYLVHQLVRHFCREKMGEDEYKAALLDASAFCLNAAKTFDPDSPESVLSKLDGRQLLFEAGEYEKADDIVTETHVLLTRWGFISQAEQLLHESIATLSGGGQAAAMGNLASIYQRRGEYDEAVGLHEKVYQVFKELNDRKNMGASLYQLSMIHRRRGDYDTALAKCKSSLEIFEKLGDKHSIANSRGQLGNIHFQRGDYDAALVEYQISLEIAEQLGDEHGVANSRGRLGNIHFQRGDYDAALVEYQISLETFEKLVDENGIAQTCLNLGNIHFQRGDYEAALVEYQTSLEIFEKLADKVGLSIATGQMGRMDEQRKDYEAAMEKYLKALAIFQDLGSPDAQKAFSDLKRLREKWGRENFDAKWLEATGEKWPEEERDPE